MKRRKFVIGVLGTASLGALGCGPGETSCEAPPGLSPAETAQRRAMHYVDRSTNAARSCAGCSFFTAAAPGACGSCQLGLGAVSPGGVCDGFSARS